MTTTFGKAAPTTNTGSSSASMKQVVCDNCENRFSLLDDGVFCPRCQQRVQRPLIVKREEVINLVEQAIVGKEVLVDDKFLEAVVILQGLTRVPDNNVDDGHNSNNVASLPPQKDHDDTDERVTRSSLKKKPKKKSPDVVTSAEVRPEEVRPDVVRSTTTSTTRRRSRSSPRAAAQKRKSPRASSSSTVSSSSTKHRSSSVSSRGGKKKTKRSKSLSESAQKLRAAFTKALADLRIQLGDQPLLQQSNDDQSQGSAAAARGGGSRSSHRDVPRCGVPGCNHGFNASGGSMWILARTNRSGNQSNIPLSHPMHLICLTCLPRASKTDQPLLIHPKEILSQAIMEEIPRCEEHTYAIGTKEDLTAVKKSMRKK